MASYKAWLKRKANATPYANEANCRKCKHGEWVRTSAFCSGRGRSVKIPHKTWEYDKTFYCPEFYPEGEYVEVPESEF